MIKRDLIDPEQNNPNKKNVTITIIPNTDYKTITIYPDKEFKIFTITPNVLGIGYRQPLNFSEDWFENIGFAILTGLNFPINNVFDFNELKSLIMKSFSITKIKDDFDGEGSLGYSVEMWHKSMRVLADMIRVSINSGSSIRFGPKVLPGPEGTIDLYWKDPRLELLVNIKREEKLPDFYGKKWEGLEIEGELSEENLPKVIEFLR